MISPDRLTDPVPADNIGTLHHHQVYDASAPLGSLSYYGYSTPPLMPYEPTLMDYWNSYMMPIDPQGAGAGLDFDPDGGVLNPQINPAYVPALPENARWSLHLQHLQQQEHSGATKQYRDHQYRD